MESWLIGLITTVCGIVLSYFVTKACETLYKSRGTYKEDRRKEEEEKIKKAVNLALESKFNNLDKKIDKLDERIDKVEGDLEKVKAGDQASLRNDLYQLYNECKHKGFATIDERENFINLYDKYHDLGANGVMDDIKGKFLSLPTEKTDKKKIRLAE